MIPTSFVILALLFALLGEWILTLGARLPQGLV